MSLRARLATALDHKIRKTLRVPDPPESETRIKSEQASVPNYTELAKSLSTDEAASSPVRDDGSRHVS